jgi:GWxTD domain-containing protein
LRRASRPIPRKIKDKAQALQETVSKPLTEKQKKKKEAQLKRELESPYRKWLNEDVTYIITDEERSAFKRLQTDEEREQFIESFWLRRDPTPDTIENEFKEEHYRRIAYANEHYASGIPGWKTDRGRIYIVYGPPDEIDDHSSGGTYERPIEEGGGTTSTYPFQDWRYRYIEGIGNNVIIEFVDPTMSGEFHMTMDASEKDALLYVPGAGLTMMEQMGDVQSKNAALQQHRRHAQRLAIRRRAAGKHERVHPPGPVRNCYSARRRSSSRTWKRGPLEDQLQRPAMQSAHRFLSADRRLCDDVRHGPVR